MNRKVSEWMPIPDYEWCAIRILVGGDPKNVADRVAYIANTAMVRTEPFDHDSASIDFRLWETVARNGVTAETKQLCDDRLVELGYILP